MQFQLLEPYREDATFLGWYDNPEFTGEPITEIPANTKEDKNVYAKWDEMARFDVTFDIGYAEGESPAAQSVIEGHKATKPADPTEDQDIDLKVGLKTRLKNRSTLITQSLRRLH